MHSERLIRYAALVFIEMNKIGKLVGEFCELTFHFHLSLPLQDNQHGLAN
jgi:hypothetical protein